MSYKKAAALSPAQKMLLAMILDKKNEAIKVITQEAAQKIRVLLVELGLSNKTVAVDEDKLEILYDDGIVADSDVGRAVRLACETVLPTSGSVLEAAGITACSQGDGDSGQD